MNVDSARDETIGAMKIGVSANALKHGGGLERYAMDLARGFAARGLTTDFFARKFDQTLSEYALVRPHRIGVSFLPGKLRDLWFSWRLGAQRRKAGVDVLIGCNRVVASDIAICGGTHRGFLAAVGRRPKRSDTWQIALERAQYARARIVVAHSLQMRDELMRLYGVAEAKIQVLYPPVDRARFSPCDMNTRSALRRRFGFQDHEVVLLFASGSHERKGLPLIEAAIRDAGLPVVVAVAGRAPESTSPHVRYLGYVKDIEACYRAADFTILASKYEPFGLVGVESVMCGTPVILSANIGCCDAIADEAKFVFEPNDAAALLAALVRAARRSAEGALGTPADLAQRGIRYDADIASHVDALIGIANRIHPAPRSSGASMYPG